MLELINVSKSFGSVRALDGVSAAFNRGEIHAVLGENGAGKSTLMNVLAGFASPDSGSIAIDGKPIPLGKPSFCRHSGIAMIHQELDLFPSLTVGDNIILGKPFVFTKENIDKFDF